MNSKYWEKFYKKNHTNEPSLFAQFCLQYLGTKSKVLDIGCGNGRDSFLFGKEGHKVMAIDRATKAKDSKLVKFLQQDIRSFMKKRVDSFDIKYCRFFFSAVEDEAIDEILGWVRQGMLLIEARDRSDKSFNKDHDRNLQHYPTLLKKLGEHGFSIVHKEVAQGLAPNGEEDPMIIRIVASKNEDVGKS